MDLWVVVLGRLCAVGWFFVGRVVVSPGDVTVEVVGPAYDV